MLSMIVFHHPTRYQIICANPSKLQKCISAAAAAAAAADDDNDDDVDDDDDDDDNDVDVADNDEDDDDDDDDDNATTTPAIISFCTMHLLLKRLSNIQILYQ